MSRRTIIIADLHGCYFEALDLLDKLAVTRSDRVIMLGDLLDRGPQRAACVKLAKKHECILGNHEEKYIIYRNNLRSGKYNAPLREDHQKTWDVITDNDINWFETLPKYIRLPEYNAALVHAGVLPYIPLEKQDPQTLLHVSNIKPPSKKSYWPSKAPDDHLFWANYWTGPERIIFGHTVFDKPLVTPHAVGIDTGCVFGMSLTAVVLPDWEIVSVPARKTYYENRRTIRKYPAMGDVSCYS